ncbi:MAG: KPN_02809 family neutral zinc metallopeptidase [Phocaeicola sp.]|uniref:KPN_02809 family neutral zinc metallopeptidase n=1 Tax=Phocaeicola TaxID=909656 RepID=UPI00234EBC8A|nr:neutral zinc metallopeptidase [Phocaeicola oris]MCE2615997.1 neutral zinc metallopeptidase [Phocaeicola oris]
MKLNGRRESSNVEDRRGLSGGQKTGLGIGGIIIVGLITLLMGGNPLDVLQQAGSMMGTEQQTTQREFTEEEQALAKFSKQILAGTEDVWTQIFKEHGATYQVPRMVLFTDGVQTGCGGATSSVGPFYCSADQALYLDLSFFSTMKQQLGADGDFAYAYVIAHEVGHHVEYLTGLLDQVHQKMQTVNETESNKLSVRLELLADFYAGVWANYDNKMFGSLEDGDIEKAINCAAVIGDDYLQKKARGYAIPESFNHGTSAQRMKWFKLGLQTGDISRGTTFQCSDEEL